jgi:hypothetical protein
VEHGTAAVGHVHKAAAKAAHLSNAVMVQFGQWGVVLAAAAMH